VQTRCHVTRFYRRKVGTFVLRIALTGHPRKKYIPCHARNRPSPEQLDFRPCLYPCPSRKAPRTNTAGGQNFPLLSELYCDVYSWLAMRILPVECKARAEQEAHLEWSELTNRRGHLRFPLRVSVRYYWRNAHGLLCQGRGRTRNVSEGGVLVVGTNCPARGDFVDLTVRVPKSAWATKEYPSSFRMSGEAVRLLIDTSGKAVCGFAMERRDLGPKKARRRMNLVSQPTDSESSGCN
jgi:hypothetical protein